MMVALERDAGAVAQGTKVQALYHERKKMHPAGSGKKQVEKNTKRCYHCEKDGHFKDECWVLHPELKILKILRILRFSWRDSQDSQDSLRVRSMTGKAPKN